MPLNIFIDTSTYLSFYAVSNDDLEQLEKLVGLIADGRVKILITSQVERELARNRDNKLAEAIGNIEKLNFKPPSIPRFMWEYDEVAELRRALLSAEKARAEAVQKAKSEANSATTNADKLIQRIFATAGIEGDDPKVFALAQRRMLIGDLPGKPNSLGDRLNWEHLLNSELTDGDLHIISKDGDYFSPLDGKSPKYALYREWVDKKNGKLLVHHEIKPFLVSKFPQFKFKSETQIKRGSTIPAWSHPNEINRNKTYIQLVKEAAIAALEGAQNGDDLTQAVQSLEKISPHLTERDLLQICNYVIRNDVVQDFNKEDCIEIFFDNIIPKIYHLLNRKEIEALEIALDKELHPEEFGTEEESLLPDYGQMDLELLDKEVDEEIEGSHTN